MSRRENTSLPEKTLKESTFAKASVDEKVERARQYLGNKGFHPHLDAVCLSITEVGVIKEALTALEEELQRARDALRWIPCEERLPEKSGNYRTTESIQPMGAEGFLYLLNFSYFDKTTKQWKGRGKIVAWMEHPSPYTPEETER